MSNGRLHEKTTENYITVTSKIAPRSLSTRATRLQEVPDQSYYREEFKCFGSMAAQCMRWSVLKSSGRTWIDKEFRGGVKLRIINFAKKLSPVHFGSFFSNHFPRKQERISFPSNIYPSRQRYFALERRMFMLMIAFFGGFLRRPRSILTHFLSRSTVKKMKINFDILTNGLFTWRWGTPNR